MINSKLLATLAAVLLFVGAGCASNSSMKCCTDMKHGDMKSSSMQSSSMDSPAAQALMKLDDEWSAAASAHNLDKVVSFYTDDAVLLPPNEPMISGHDAVHKMWAGYMGDPSVKLSWKATSAGVDKDGAMGWTSGTYDLSMKSPDGKMINEKGKTLCVWQKQSDGKWKSVRDMWSSDSK